MHHHIFPSKDTFITNRPTLDDKNFGIDEILQIGTTNTVIKTLSSTKTYIYSGIIFNGQSVNSFTGIFTGSFKGTANYTSGNMSGSNLMFSASYFSGFIDGIPQVGSGLVSGSEINVFISGSVIVPLVSGLYIGTITDGVACFTGTGSGADIREEQNWTDASTKYIDRSLLAFDLTAISESIVNGDIVDPHFFLNVKVCNEYDLPITYTIYALPINQNWNMGNGYLSDGGSDKGVSWRYVNNYLGTPWYAPSLTTPRPAIDFITNPSLATASFGYGGGTWNTTSYCSQTFRYKSADIDMDVTSIVMSWLSGSILNQGLLLIQSDELQTTGSGFILKYFSRDTNTIYSPYLDVAWNDSINVTGSISTGSVIITNIVPGISGSIQSGSTFSIAGGISGSFSASSYIIASESYIIANNQIFNYSAPNSIINDTWYANNGYHYDSWQTAWQLDPNHGGFLPNTDIQVTPIPDYGSPPILKFTGSYTGSFIGVANVYGTFTGSGEFSASYFSGSLDNISVEINGAVSASNIQGFLSSSVSMSLQIGNYIGELTSSLVYLNGTGSGIYLDSTYYSFDGFINGIGYSGNINGDSIFGNVKGLISNLNYLVTKPCGNSYSASLSKAVFYSGPFSGSSFTAYYSNYQFKDAFLTGSWTQNALLGTDVTIRMNSALSPFTFAYVTGPYISGNAFGKYIVSGSNETNGTASAGANSASFSGQFYDGNLVGGYLYLQISGSVFTSSYSYTSSVFMTSSVMTPLNVKKPFTVNVQNLQPEYKSGDIIKIDLFGRKKFPLKHFGKSTQQEQYLVPEYLPSASYYALRDNQTNEIVMPFDSYTQISCDYPNGNFFIVDTTGLAQERYYRVLIQVNDADETYTIDSGKTFKITR